MGLKPCSFPNSRAWHQGVRSTAKSDRLGPAREAGRIREGLKEERLEDLGARAPKLRRAALGL